MKIILIGGTGTLGQAITKALSRHEVLIAGRNSGDLRCDIESEESIRAMYEKSGVVDAVIVAAGRGPFLPLDKLTTEDFYIALKSKLMGQINTVMLGRNYVKESFTLTTGILSIRPVKQSAALSTANSGLEGFVRAAALELSQRINCVSPTLVDESAVELGGLFPGVNTVPVSEVAKVYQQSVEGTQTGATLQIW